MYANQTQIEAILGRCLSDSEQATIKPLETAVENWINDQIGGSFGAVSESTRYYDGCGSILDIDPVINITAIKIVNGYEESEYDYILGYDLEAMPRNDTVKTYLQQRFSPIPHGLRNIAVTGQFTLGDSVPDDIKYLASYMVAQVLQGQATGNLKSESIEGYSRTFGGYKTADETVKMILSRYTENLILI